MRRLAICGEKVQVPESSSSYVTSVKVDGVTVHCGLLDSVDPLWASAESLQPQKVLIKVKAFSCNYRDKALILSAATQGKPDQINVIGSEFVGEVIAIGSAVNDLQIGDRVIANGAYPDSGASGVRGGLPTNHGSLEYRVIHRAKLVKIPPEMPDEVGAAFTIGAQTTYSMIRKVNPVAGDNVLITAAKSNTSLFAIQALRQYDINVYVTSRSLKFERELLNLGVKRVIQIDPQADPWIDPDLARQIQDETEGFDCIIDPFFDLHIGKLLPALKQGGRYITCGLYDQYSQYTGETFEYKGDSIRNIFTTAMLNNLHLIGNCLGTTEDLERAIADYAAGRLEVVIDSIFTGNEIEAFIDRTYNNPDRFGKVVYRYQSS